MNFIKTKFQFLFFALLLLSFLFFTATAQQKNSDWYIWQAPFKMSKVPTPSFPGRDFSIKDYGAVGDGQTLNTDAFAKAINACSQWKDLTSTGGAFGNQINASWVFGKRWDPVK